MTISFIINQSKYTYKQFMIFQLLINFAIVEVLSKIFSYKFDYTYSVSK
jgi:hypothetical protein